MKHLQILLLLLMLATSTIAQKVVLSKIEINKGYPAIEQQIFFSMQFAVLTDISNFTNKLDATKSKFTRITDDTGFDLLKAQAEYEKSTTYAQMIEFQNFGMINSSETPGFIAQAKVHAMPKPGTKSVKVEGVIAMINTADGEKKVEVKNVPSHWNSEGIDSEIGMIKIADSGSASMNDISYNIYRVQCKLPVASVKVVGGDDSAEAKEKINLGIERNEIVFKKIPETLDLIITVNNSEVIEIPFSLDISIGF